MEEHKETYKSPIQDTLDQRVDLPQSFKIICCPNCATEVPAENLSISDKIGKCGSCHAVFSIEKDIVGLQQNHEKITQEILRPEGIEVFHFKGELEVSFEQPFSWIDWVLILVMPLLLLAGIVVSIKSFSVITAIGLFVPPVLTYLHYRRRKEKFRKYISVDKDFIDIIWRPRLFHTNQRYAINDIIQLYVKYNPNMGYWQLNMIIDEGHGQKHVKLTSVMVVSKAKYLEQIIESHLGIQDVKVSGEA